MLNVAKPIKAREHLIEVYCSLACLLDSLCFANQTLKVSIALILNSAGLELSVAIIVSRIECTFHKAKFSYILLLFCVSINTQKNWL